MTLSAREVIEAGWAKIFPDKEATYGELIFAQAVCRIETGYGTGWARKSMLKRCPDGIDSNNWGAVQAGKPPCDSAGSFLCSDTHEAGDRYAICFKRYPTSIDGAADVIRILYKQMHLSGLARAGNYANFAAGMREAGYYEAPLSRYTKAFELNLPSVLDAYGVENLEANAARPISAEPVKGNWAGAGSIAPLILVGAIAGGFLLWKRRH